MGDLSVVREIATQPYGVRIPRGPQGTVYQIKTTYFLGATLRNPYSTTVEGTNAADGLVRENSLEDDMSQLILNLVPGVDGWNYI